MFWECHSHGRSRSIQVFHSTQLLVSLCVYPLNLYSIRVFTFPAFMILLFRIQEIKIPPRIHPIPHLLFCYLIFPPVIFDGNQDTVELNKCHRLSPPSCYAFIQEYNRIKQCITYTLLILISKIHCHIASNIITFPNANIQYTLSNIP